MLIQVASLTAANCTSYGTLRLVGQNSTAMKGTLEICLNSTWGTVCDAFFGYTASQVACRQLGYFPVDATGIRIDIILYEL